MSIVSILMTAAVVGIVGLIVGVLLVTAGERFKVEVNEQEQKVRAQLPGNNCGGCGYPGCDGLAAAIAAGEAPADACPVGGVVSAAKIAEILGVEVEKRKRYIAYVSCSGDCDTAADVCNYVGIRDCRAAMVVPGKGAKGCIYGCRGYGSCVQVCKFDAIHVEKGVAVVNSERCVGCGACVQVCPNGLITLIPEDAKYVVRCKSQEKGKAVKEICAAGCIGCTACTRQCEQGAITMKGNVACIDQEICTQCGACVQKCPVQCIQERVLTVREEPMI